MTSQRTRARMIERLRTQGIVDEVVLAAMNAVPRHIFVEEALASRAYDDVSLPINFGQTISNPQMVARMSELLRAGSDLGRVLEIGTGCGYQAAVLSHCASEVYSIERLRALHDKARTNLRSLRLANVHLLFGDGMQGYAKGAPYQSIIAAAVGEAIPQAWLDQLALGGRLVAPLARPGQGQALVLIEKSADGLRQSTLDPVVFVPLKSGIA